MKSLQNRKVQPLPDGIPSDGLKMIVPQNHRRLLQMYNAYPIAEVFAPSSKLRPPHYQGLRKFGGAIVLPATVYWVDTAGRLFSATREAGNLLPDHMVSEWGG